MKKHPYLAELISNYFNRKLEQEGDETSHGSTFESEKVYNKVLGAIDKQRHSTILLRRSLVIAAAMALLAGLVGTGYYYNNRTHKDTLVEKTTAKGKTLFLALADGTKVWLNADSKLSYPKDFNTTAREISLSGEAYFEIVHSDKKPFIIHTGDVRTVVLGTSFNIKAYPGNQKVEVTVISGKVAVITPKKEGKEETTLYLTPDQTVTYNKEKKQLDPFTHINAKESIGWKEGKMIYRGTGVKQVIEDLERKYNTRISYNQKISNCTITADFNNDPLITVLTVLARMVEGTISFKDGTYYLDGKGCE